jgi:hypothetical protein
MELVATAFTFLSSDKTVPGTGLIWYGHEHNQKEAGHAYQSQGKEDDSPRQGTRQAFDKEAAG